MKKLLNTLYVTSPDAYLTLENENVKISVGDSVLGRFPLHIIESIACFSYAGASPELIAKCVSLRIGFSMFSPSGRFLYRATGDNIGNVLLRKAQYAISSNNSSLSVIKNMIMAKIYNGREFVRKCFSNHPMQIDKDSAEIVIERMTECINQIKNCTDKDEIRGIEGKAAQYYFEMFNNLIIVQKEDFVFERREKRPPKDPVNCMLSFGYTLLANDCANALSGVGLDPYVGFLHSDRAGRKSLALDLEEEFRTVFVDRYIVSLINTRQISKSDFLKQEDNSFLFSEDGKKKFLNGWQKYKQQDITHPYLGKKMSRGLIPHAQSLLLARYIRGDLDGYPPFFWR